MSDTASDSTIRKTHTSIITSEGSPTRKKKIKDPAPITSSQNSGLAPTTPSPPRKSPSVVRQKKEARRKCSLGEKKKVSCYFLVPGTPTVANHVSPTYEKRSTTPSVLKSSPERPPAEGKGIRSNLNVVKTPSAPSRHGEATSRAKVFRKRNLTLTPRKKNLWRLLGQRKAGFSSA